MMEPRAIKTENDFVILPENIPAFLLKLWKLVEDPTYNDMIAWNRDGTSFKVHDQAALSKIVLPKYYKHNNFSSFVRQVNMYGFRKRIDLEKGGVPRCGKVEWEFFHPSFQRSRPEDLCFIKRKPAKGEAKFKPVDISGLLEDVNLLKSQHILMSEKLDVAKNDNEHLLQEIYDLRNNHNRQQLIINKLIRFLLQIVMGKDVTSRKRRSLDLNGNVSVVLPKVSRIASEQLIQPYHEQHDHANKELCMIDLPVSSNVPIIITDNQKERTGEKFCDPLDSDFISSQNMNDLSSSSELNIGSNYFSYEQFPMQEPIDYTSTSSEKNVVTEAETREKGSHQYPDDLFSQDYTGPLLAGLSERPLDFEKISNNLDSLHDVLKSKQLSLDSEVIQSLFADVGSFLSPQVSCSVFHDIYCFLS